MSESPEDALEGLAGLDGASASIFARETGGDSDEVLASHSPDRALAPASNTKLLTAALALDVLGPEYRFETRARSDAERAGGRLDGDLRLIGGGAPDLAPEDLADLAARVSEAGVERVAGDLLFDDSLFGGGQLGPGWTWGDEQHAYGARSAALSLSGNAVAVEIADSGEDGDFEASLSPDTPAVSVTVDLEAGDDDCSVYTDHETGVVRVEGTLPAGSERTERAPVAEPARHCALAFRAALADAGVEVAGDVRERTEPADETGANRSGAAARGRSRSVSCVVESAPVSELIREMNVPSDNFIAEQLARSVGAKRLGDADGTGGADSGDETDEESDATDHTAWEAWTDVVTDRLETLGVGSCRIRDGSGLSRYNLVTARGVVALLSWAGDQPWREPFFASLPAPGEGTLETRLADAEGVRAKTGTLTGTCALSGRVEREERPDVLFSMLLSGLTGDVETARERQDAFVRSLK